MTALDLATVVVAVAAVIAVAVAVVVVLTMRESVRELRSTLELIRERTVPAVESLEADATRIRDDLDHVDGLLTRADAVAARAEGLSRVTYRAIADPVIRTASIIKGTSRAGRRLRRSVDGDDVALEAG